MKQSFPAFSWSLVNQMPIIGIVRNISVEDTSMILPGYVESGLTTIEITMNTPGASEMIQAFGKEYQGKLNMGAGTVRNTKELEVALESGATFIVTPNIDEEVIRECVRQNVPIFPGAYTPSEIYKAWNLGASIVKVFPATSLGPGYFKDVLAPLNEVKLMPTGGVSLDTIEGFYHAGAVAYGIGSPLFNKDLILSKEWAALTQHFKKFTELLSRLRSPR